MERVRGGDRFWYENTNPPHYPFSVQNEIKSTTFKDILVRNSAINPGELQANIFVRN